MINKLKSARLAAVWFVLVLPMVAALLLAFRGKGTGNNRFTGGVGTDTLTWTIRTQKREHHPVYLLNGKPSDAKTVHEYADAKKVISWEYSGNEDMAKKYGPQYNEIENFRTGKEDGSIFSPGPAANKEGGSNSVLYTDMPNVLKVEAEGIPFSQLEARISEGTVVKSNGCFVLQPVKPGYNVELVIYTVEDSGLKQLDTHYYRTVAGDARASR